MEKTVGSATEDITRQAPVDPEAKWIWLQEVGLAQFFAVPFVIIFAALLGIKSFIPVFLSIVIIIVGGFYCLRIGDKKRVELRDKGDNQ